MYDTQVSAVRTDCLDPTAPVPPGGADSANLFVNGDFASGALPPWDALYTMTWQITNGVFEFLRPNSTPPAGVLLQAVGPVPAGQTLLSTFQLGNSSAQRRRVTILLNDQDFSDLVACTFWLAANQPPSDYAIRTFTTKPWANAMISIYSATIGPYAWTLFDNASLRMTPSTAAIGTECIEPVPAGPVSSSSASASASAPPGLRRGR